MDTIVFVASKTVGIAAKFETWLVLVFLLGLVQLYRGRLSAGRRWVLLGVALLVVVTVVPVGVWIIRPLENAYERPVDLPGGVKGIIVLGGAEGGASPKGEPMLNDAAERMTEAAALARQLDAPIVWTGGSGLLTGGGEVSGAVWAERMFAQLGVPADRILYEGQSRTTAENAKFTYAMLEPKDGETWLLVTSAWHLPRSMASFERAGWTGLIPWPTDYRQEGSGAIWRWHLVSKLTVLNRALNEYVGLLAYWILGR